MVDSHYQQMELFPKATVKDIEKAKLLLEEYEECISIRDDYESDSIDDLSEIEVTQYNKCVYKIKRIERAVRQIRNHDIREMISYRYIQCHTFTETSYRYTHSSCMDERTVSRKLNRGIESVAGSLKSFENVSK